MEVTRIRLPLNAQDAYDKLMGNVLVPTLSESFAKEGIIGQL